MSMEQQPRWKGLVAWALGLLLVFGAIYLREAKLWVWPMALADALVVFACLVAAAGALWTERARKVRVYLSTRSYVYIHRERDA